MQKSKLEFLSIANSQGILSLKKGKVKKKRGGGACIGGGREVGELRQ